MRVDTTQNASVTELFPAIAFNTGYKPTTIEAFQEYLLNLNMKDRNVKKAFVTTQNESAGRLVIERTLEMEKRFFKDKMENAIGITNYLYELDKSHPIDKVIWGYREKPTGIPKNHAGDIFVFFKDRHKLGISLKAGTTKSKEPLLNTYVGTTFRKLNKTSELDKLKDAMWDQVYSKIPGVTDVATKQNYTDRGTKNKVTELYVDYFVNNQTKADELYNKMLYVNRVHTCDMINALSLDEFTGWVMNNFNLQLPGSSDEVPLVLVKAIGKKADEKKDDLASMIGNVKSYKAYLNRKSVQEWIIEITTHTDDTAKLKMTIRSDSGVRADKAPGKQGRLGRYTELKLQYSGLL